MTQEETLLLICIKNCHEVKMNQEKLFYQGLETGNIEILEGIHKSDLHNHAGRGGHISDLSEAIEPPSKPFNDLDDMQVWFEKHVKAVVPKGIDGYLLRVEAAFKQAKRDHIKKLSLSFGFGEVFALGGMENFTKTMNAFKEKYIPDSHFQPELSLLRGRLSLEDEEYIKDIIDHDWFETIDVCGTEDCAPVSQYKGLFQYAKSKSMILRIHVGEFGTAEDVREAIEVLDLDEIHHGIAAADNPEVMALLKEKGIVLHVCPTSNVMLKRVKDYPLHPIKTLYDAGVRVTINTDDLTIFNATVSQEYLYLYQHGVLSKEALNKIRIGGLTNYKESTDE